MKEASISDFDHIFALMDEAFPDVEMRTYEGQKALLSKQNYKILIQYDGGCIESMMALWEFPHFIFIEHFAICKQKRGYGIGSLCLEEFLRDVQKPVILEVEPACDDITKKRISFYERRGFHLHTYSYMQPPLRKDKGGCPLQIMSYPNALTLQQFEEMKDILYKEVYGTIFSKD